MKYARTAKERRALLAYARWWLSDMDSDWTAAMHVGWKMVEFVEGGRARVAESLAYEERPVRR